MVILLPVRATGGEIGRSSLLCYQEMPMLSEMQDRRMQDGNGWKVRQKSGAGAG
jgi:hypothetical protein